MHHGTTTTQAGGVRMVPHGFDMGVVYVDVHVVCMPFTSLGSRCQFVRSGLGLEIGDFMGVDSTQWGTS